MLLFTTDCGLRFSFSRQWKKLGRRPGTAHVFRKIRASKLPLKPADPRAKYKGEVCEMRFPNINPESLWKLHVIILEIEGIILNVILFIQMCLKHIRK